MWKRKIQMKLLKNIKELYFKIPRKTRFLIYYAIAFYMFLHTSHRYYSIDMSFGNFLESLLYKIVLLLFKIGPSFI